MLALLGSVFSGGLTGLLGVGLQRFFDFMKIKQELELKKLEYAQAQEMRKIDAQIMQQEWAARTKVAELEEHSRETVAAEGSFAASFGMEPKQYSERAKIGPTAGAWLVGLDVLRGVIRPGLTVYLCAITTAVYLEARGILAAAGASLNPSQALAVHDLIVGTILYLTTTTVLWWFGTRNSQHPPQK